MLLPSCRVCLSQTVRFKNELERNITIKLGYANAKIYFCKDPECPRPGNFITRGSSAEDVVVQGKWTYELVRHVSFVDCPGHDILMATMLNGVPELRQRDPPVILPLPIGRHHEHAMPCVPFVRCCGNGCCFVAYSWERALPSATDV